MKRLVILSLSILAITGASAQRVAKVTISQDGVIESFSIATDDAVVNISSDGQMLNYGVEYFSERATNYSRVEPFQGRIDFFTQTDDAAFRGKLKYLGRTPITYYASYDAEDLRGKVKSIGRVAIDYYRPFEDAVTKGKLKTIGTTKVQWYGAFDNDLIKGKLKSLATTNLTYYSSFDDRAFRGKVKAIGSNNFTYYSSFDLNFQGAMKTGQQVSVVNGVYFFIR